MWTTGDHKLSDCPQVDGQPAASFRFTPRVYTTPNEYATTKNAQTHLKFERKMKIVRSRWSVVINNNYTLIVVAIRSYVDIVKYVVFHVKFNRKRRREDIIRRYVFVSHLTVFQDHERRIDVALVFDLTLSLNAVTKEKTRKSRRGNQCPDIFEPLTLI